jgi:hypothetical protein
MKFDSSDFKSGLQNISSKLDDGVSLSDLTNAINIPELSEFSKLAEKMTPKNLIKFGEDGKVNLLSLTELQKSLNSGLSDIKGYLEGEILGLFESIRGEIQGVYDEAKSVYDEVSNISNTISKGSSQIVDASLDAFNQTVGLNLKTQDLGNIYKTATNTIESFTKLSPKKLKDLSDPNFFKNVVDTTLQSTLNVTGAAAEYAAADSLIKDQMDNSSYMNHFSNSLSKSKNVLPKKQEEKEGDFTYSGVVERRVYWGKGEGATPESAAQKSNSGSKLVNDYSLAVDNSTVLIGSKVSFSDDKKEREAVDVATPSKGLSSDGVYTVIGIYFETKENALEYQKKYPEKYVNITVKVPNSERKKIEKNRKKRKEELNKKLNKELEAVDKKIAELEKKTK